MCIVSPRKPHRTELLCPTLRSSERADQQSPPYSGKLSALRVPERTVMHDDGEDGWEIGQPNAC